MHLNNIDKRTNLVTDIGQEALTELETNIKTNAPLLIKDVTAADNNIHHMVSINATRNLINSNETGTYLSDYWSNHFGITTLQARDILQTLQSSEFTNPYAENKKTDISQILFDRNKFQSAITIFADMTLMVKDYLNQNLQGTLDYITQPSANTGTNLMADSETASKFYRLPYNISDRSNPYKDYYKKPPTGNGDGDSGGTGWNLEKLRMGPRDDSPEQDLNGFGLTLNEDSNFYFGDNTAEAGVNGEQDSTPPDNIKLPSKDENETGAGGTVFNYNVKTEGMKTDDQINNPDHYRLDGSKKGSGWLGVFELPNGTIVSEYSISVELDGMEMEIPTLVPTLTLEERALVLQSSQDGSKLTQAIYGKAVRHAMSQISNGNSPFVEGELNWKKYEKQQPSIPQETQPVTGEYIRPDRLPDGAEAAKILKQRNIEIQKRKDNISPGIIGDIKNTPDVETQTLNITRNKFPVRLNKDGSVSTIATMSFVEKKNGPEILIPTIINGKQVTDKEAIAHYKTTKEHFGIFSTKEKANAYAQELISNEQKSVDKDEKIWSPLIKTYEGFESKSYNKDSHWTIGWGSTTHPDGTPVKSGDKITKEKADLYLKHYVYNTVIPTLSKKIPQWDKMNPNQQAALISFAYNMGPNFYGAAERETITAALKSPATWNKIPTILPLYNKARSKTSNKLEVMNGLIARRKDEAKLWLTPYTN